MFRRKRSDTTVGHVESTYGINLNARSDALLGNLLQKRGFDTLSQMLDAYRLRATKHARRRRLFLSFHAEDLRQVQGFRLMTHNDRVSLDFYDGSVREPVDSEDSSYIRSRIREKIKRTCVTVCLIGNGTAWRDWVDWELTTSYELRHGLCGVRLKGSRGRAPPLLKEIGAPVAKWDQAEMVAAIESAAARRS